LKKKEEKIDLSNKQTAIIGAISIEDWKLREFFSIGEFSKLVGVSRWTLWRAIKRNELTVAKIGARVIINRKEIEKFIIKVPHNDQSKPTGEEVSR
jgi:excisionase family DNA binding protein